jgi:hypothetical protein
MSLPYACSGQTDGVSAVKLSWQNDISTNCQFVLYVNLKVGKMAVDISSCDNLEVDIETKYNMCIHM